MRTIAEFKISYFQYLDPEGNLTAPAPAFARDTNELLKMYRAMMLARIFDARAVNLQRTGKLGTYASCLGHEATHIGVGAALRPEDCIAPVYRESGTQLWRGVRMVDILLYWGGDERGSDFAHAPHDFPFCVPIATQTLHAAGAAMAFKIRKQPRCALAFIGDGGTSEGSFYEAINLAGARQLPVVFMIVNNGWAISVPVAAQTATQTLAQKAVAAGIPGLQVDGNDLIAVRELVGRAVATARSGGGPTVIEALTYRLSDHTTSDDASRYRPADEVEKARREEPLIRIRKYMMRMGALNESQDMALRAECTAEVERAAEEYLRTPAQSTAAMFDYLFANMPARLRAQKEQALHCAQTGAH